MTEYDQYRLDSLKDSDIAATIGVLRTPYSVRYFKIKERTMMMSSLLRSAAIRSKAVKAASSRPKVTCTATRAMAGTAQSQTSAVRHFRCNSKNLYTNSTEESKTLAF
jgi:hypothetical protein